MYRKLLLALQYGAPSMIGLGMRNPFLIQGVEKLTIYLEKRGSNLIIGNLIQANFEAALIYVGIGKAGIFSLDYKKMSPLLLNI